MSAVLLGGPLALYHFPLWCAQCENGPVPGTWFDHHEPAPGAYFGCVDCVRAARPELALEQPL